ncbi:MAG: NAD(P)H-hydrate dehydratase [Anaerolineae bacterium]
MLKVATKNEIRRIEASANAQGLSYQQMMENAGRAVGKRVIDILHGKENAKVTVIVGSGSNGGDGLVAGRIIAQESDASVRFYLMGTRSETDTNYTTLRDAGLELINLIDDNEGQHLQRVVADADVILDALFGIGVRLPLGEEAIWILKTIDETLKNRIKNQIEHRDISMELIPSFDNSPKTNRSFYVIAVDTPSGLNCDTGEVSPYTLVADETITFIAAKPGLFEYPAVSRVGVLRVASLEIPDDLPELQEIKHVVSHPKLINDYLPVRSRISNKGNFGKILVVGGSSSYIGALGLSAMAAYRTGCGLVTIASIEPVIRSLSSHLFEPTWQSLFESDGSIGSDVDSQLIDHLCNSDSILLGPGLGTKSPAKNFLLNTLSKLGENSPLILDADALNILSEFENWWSLLPRNTILTPHPGEMARLAKTSVKEVLNQRWQIAKAKSKEWNVILVLKGANTLIANPQGSVVAIPFATDALATAGTGDVLAGLIAGFVGQGLAPEIAAQVGAYLHGLAGIFAVANMGNSRSVLAGDVLNAVPQALTKIENAL